MKLKAILAMAMSTTFLAACGGGGGDSVINPMEAGYGTGQTFTYFDQGGLTWSSPSKGTYVYVTASQIFSGLVPENASGYCSQSTSTNGGPTTPINFNKSEGWRLPTIGELRSLHAEIPNPVNWTLGDLWAQGLARNRFQFDFEVWRQTYDFRTGGFSLPGADEMAHVTCVKPIAPQ